LLFYSCGAGRRGLKRPLGRQVDVAEALHRPAAQLAQILKGQKYDMVARAYFAVVTGTKNADDSIDAIRAAEAAFFEGSPLFLNNAFSVQSMGASLAPERRDRLTRGAGTENLARAVSQAFWELVHASVHSELQTTAAALAEREREWKRRFPGAPVLTRDDLLVQGRHAVLERLARAGARARPQEWEDALAERLWAECRHDVIDRCAMARAAGGSGGGRAWGWRV